MPCDNKEIQTTRRKNKDGDVITTHTSKRVCANNEEDIREEEEKESEEEEMTTEAIKEMFSRFLPESKSH